MGDLTEYDYEPLWPAGMFHYCAYGHSALTMGCEDCSTVLSVYIVNDS